MADALSVIIKTQLELDRKAQISKLNNELSNDKSARVNVIAGLNINKTKDLIKSNLATLSNQTQFNINNITFGKINTAQLQSNINQATANTKATIAVTPVLDRSKFGDTESYIKEIVKQLSNPDIANNINFNTILNGLKEKFGLASKDIRTELSNFIQALKLTPNDKQAILNSYQNLMGAIENASGIANGKNFTENISDAIYRLATTFPEVGNKAQQATQSMTEGLKQTEKAAEQVNSAVQKINTSTTANPIADKRNKSTAQAFDKANTQIIKDNLDKIVSAYREIGTLSNQITKGNIGANEVAVNKELIALKEESIKLATEDLEKNGLLTNEIRNQIEAEKQRVAESQKKVQAQVADTAIAQQAKAYEQQAKAIHTYTTQIQNDLNQLNKMSANTVFTTNTSNPQVQAQKTAIQDLIKEYEKLKATMNSNMSTADLEKARARLEELRAQLKNANTDMATLRSSMQSDKSAQKLAGDIAILTAQIKQFRSANSKSEAKFGSEYDSLLQKLKQNPDVSGLYAIRQQFRQLQGDVRAAGLTGTTFFDKLKADAAKFSAWFGVAAPGMLIAREIRQMFSEVVNLDEALFDLRKTFQGTDDDLKEFYYTSNDIARQLGVTTEEVINSASSWSRLGYSTKEAAETMARLAAQFAVISPGMDIDKATDGLVSIMKANICLNVQKCA